MKPNSPASPTLQALIFQKLKEKGISKSQLVSSIGYPRNLNKGIRRLNEYLTTLEAPNDEFVINLLNTLSIDGLSFHRALNASIDLMNKEADEHSKRRFKPHIIVLRDKTITPRFIDEIITRQNTILIPDEIQNLSFTDELHEIFKIYDNFNDKIYYSNTSEVFRFTKTGLRYHRKHNYSMVFSANHHLKRIDITSPRSKFKMGLGNKLVDLLSGSTHY
ncbi:MAG: hypothetical protein KJ630_23525 [Proteobacteria bacterium]|nr:hypothetical protein [Pseudomonadota bacterium]